MGDKEMVDEGLLKRLISVRKSSGLSQIEFAMQLGVSDATIRNYEQGRTKPTKRFLDHMCEVYNISIDWLYTGEGEMMANPTKQVPATVGERLYTIRSREALSQEAFGRSISMTGGGYAGIEQGRVNATDRVISDVCRVYGISEKWLRTGEGDMYDDHSEEQEFIAQISALLANEPKSFRRRMISALLRLTDEQVDMIIDVVNKLYDAQNKK